MVGLSVVLEYQSKVVNKKTPQVINKATMVKQPTPLSPPSTRLRSSPTFLDTSFLHHCFLCKLELLPGKDIYMYKGDRAFCSVECRCRQIFMDEEETVKRPNCSLAAMRPRPTSSSSSSRNRRGSRDRANGREFSSPRVSGFPFPGAIVLSYLLLA